MINTLVESIVDKALAGELLNKDEIASLFRIAPLTAESSYIQSAARQISSRINNNLSEIHCHVGVNLGPCAHNCKWCSFASVNKVFPKASTLSIEDIITRCTKFEKDGVNAIYLVTTGMYPCKRLVETVQEVRRKLDPATILIANADDFSLEEAHALKDAGLNGVYHAVRFREGIESSIPVEKRFATMRNAHEVGLTLGTCVEPVGPEHSVEELVDATVIARECDAVFSGTMRRIPIPDTEIGKRGMLTEAQMAHIHAVIRLSTQHKMLGMCWHEPSIVGPLIGANLMWAETGSSPRDIHEDCEATRGHSVADLRKMYWEAGWQVLDGPSRIWNSIQ
jgi:biotin synthase